MIFNLNEQKVLSDPSGSSVFKGEKDFNDIVVNLPDNIDGHTATELNYVMHFVDSDGGYSTKILTVDSSGETLKATATVSTNITSKAQAFYAYLLMTDDEETVIGKTNGVIVMIHPVPDEENEIIPPADADKIIKGLEEIVQEATETIETATDTIEEATEAISSKQDKLTAGENITISNDNVISASGGVTDYTELENLPYILYSFSTGAFESVPLTGTLLAGNYLRITKYSTRFTIDVNTQRVLTTEHQLNLNLNDRGEYPFIKSARAQSVTNLPSFVQAKYNSDITLIQFAGNAISTWLQLLIWIDNSLTPHYAKRLYANNGFFAWEETKNITIVSGVVNANGTITFTDSDGNTFTTTGSSVIGPQGDDYVLTAQDKSDIADIVLSELPTTQGVLYGNQSN